MQLSNVQTYDRCDPVNIIIDDERIAAIEIAGDAEKADNFAIRFNDAIAFPGLINSHDHLDFNCFAPLGRRKYDNYRQWGKHIHRDYKKDIGKVLRVPQELRTLWGMYKNLLAGVTTVVNHGQQLNIGNPLITILQDHQNLHSVAFEKNWKWKLNNPLYKNHVCVIHAGEGTDGGSHQEIFSLLKYNLLKRKLVGIHGVAMDAEQAKLFASVVWCPESNGVLLGRHAKIEQLINSTKVVLGTDSTLTGRWNIFDHLGLARSLGKVSDEELFRMVSRSPGELWELNSGELIPGKDADIVIVKKNNRGAPLDIFFDMNPEDILMILHKGSVRMFDQSMIAQLSDMHVCVYKFSRITINGVVKFIEGDLDGLMDAIRSYNTEIKFPVNHYVTDKSCVDD